MPEYFNSPDGRTVHFEDVSVIMLFFFARESLSTAAVSGLQRDATSICREYNHSRISGFSNNCYFIYRAISVIILFVALYIKRYKRNDRNGAVIFPPH